MKVKMHVVLTCPENFASGENDYAFSLYSEPQNIAGWTTLNAVEVIIPDELLADIHRQAIAELDEKEKQTRETFETAMGILQNRRAKVLALAHNPEAS